MDRGSNGVVTCHECAFWVDLNQRDGTCRRHAPAASDTMDEVAHWPLTHRGDQCGEGAPAKSGITGITCDKCVYWRAPPEGGLAPYSRRDQLSAWWSNAGHCTRYAPMPTPTPGYRAYWRVTHATDGCRDGATEQV